MGKKYFREKLNKILLTKKVNDFYLAIIENRQQLLTDDEYNELVKGDITICGDSSKDIEKIFKDIQLNDQLKKVKNDLMRVIYSLASIRNLAIITIIDDDVYDIGNARYVDLRRNKIIRFDNLENYYSENNCRLKLFTPEVEPRLAFESVLIDVDDESIIQKYESMYINQNESNDLTGDFFIEVKGKSYVKKIGKKDCN